MELFEEEVEIYNSKMKNLSWVYDELRIQPEIFLTKITIKRINPSLNVSLLLILISS